MIDTIIFRKRLDEEVMIMRLVREAVKNEFPPETVTSISNRIYEKIK